MRTFLLLLVTLVLTACPKEPDMELENTYWILTQIEGKTVAEPDKDKRRIFLQIPEGAEDRVEGYAGCNAFFGNCEVKGETLSFSRMSTTKRMCPDMDSEQAFLSVLEQADRYTLDGAYLHFWKGEKKIASFLGGQDKP